MSRLLSPEEARKLGLPTDDAPAAPVEDPTAPSTGEAALRGIGQGLTADWGDEAAGALDYFKKAAKGENARGSYEHGRDEARAKNKAAQAAHPVAYGAGHLAGDVGLGAASLATGLGVVGAGAALGGATASGASESADPMELLKQTGVGAAEGALFGKAAQLGGKLVGAGAKATSGPMAKMADKLTAETLAGPSDEAAAKALRTMAAGRGGELTERAGRLGLLDTMDRQARREAAQVAQESISAKTGEVMHALDAAPEVEGPSFKSLVAGVNANKNLVPLLHGKDAIKNGALAQEFINPLASTEGWAGMHEGITAMGEDLRPVLQRMAEGGKLSDKEAIKVGVFRAAKGVFDKAAEDAAQAGGQPLLSAQINSLGKDMALSRLVSRTTTDLEQGAADKLYQRLNSAIDLATGTVKHPLRTAGKVIAAGVPGSTATKAKLALAASKFGSGQGAVSSKIARLVGTSGDDVAAQIMGENSADQPADGLKVAAAHMVAQQSNPSYQQKAADLAKKLSKEKPK